MNDALRSGDRTGHTARCYVVVLDDRHHHHLFAQYAEMNSKICNVPERKANSFSSNNCPWVQNCNNKNTTITTLHSCILSIYFNQASVAMYCINAHCISASDDE